VQKIPGKSQIKTCLQPRATTENGQDRITRVKSLVYCMEKWKCNHTLLLALKYFHDYHTHYISPPRAYQVSERGSYMMHDNNDKQNGMIFILEKRPLGEAIQEILRNNTPADFRSQIDTLKKQLSGPVVEEIRRPLEEALANLQEAERKATLPLHVEIAKAISLIARKNGLSVAKNRPAAKAAATTSVKPHRTTPAEMKKLILETLPVKCEDGIPGSTVARSCGVTYQTIRKHLVQLADNGSIVRQGIGKNTTWHRSQD